MPSRAIPFGFAVLAAGLAPVAGAERITVELRPEAGVTCGELSTPRPWTVPPYEQSPDWSYAGLEGSAFHLVLGGQIDVRRADRLLLGVFSFAISNRPGVAHPNRLDSSDRYAVVEEKGKLVLAPATESEWQSARVLPHTERHINVQEGQDGRPILYSGHTFAPSGKHWWRGVPESTVLSPDGALVALLSWDGKINTPDPFSFFGSSKIKGHYFADLYQVSSGRKLGLIRGGFSGVIPGFGESFWIEGPRFVMPVSADMRRLVLCEVP